MRPHVVCRSLAWTVETIQSSGAYGQELALSVLRKARDMHVSRQYWKSASLALSIVCVACTGFATMAMAQDVLSKVARPAVSNRKQALEVASFDRQRISRLADQALGTAPISITQFPAKLSEGGLHDFYSNGDYWWPDSNKADGLPCSLPATPSARGSTSTCGRRSTPTRWTPKCSGTWP